MNSLSDKITSPPVAATRHEVANSRRATNQPAKALNFDKPRRVASSNRLALIPFYPHPDNKKVIASGQFAQISPQPLTPLGFKKEDWRGLFSKIAYFLTIYYLFLTIQALDFVNKIAESKKVRRFGLFPVCACARPRVYYNYLYARAHVDRCLLPYFLTYLYFINVYKGLDGNIEVYFSLLYFDGCESELNGGVYYG